MVQTYRHERSRQELLWEKVGDDDETWHLGSQSAALVVLSGVDKLSILLPLFSFYCFCFPLSCSHS